MGEKYTSGALKRKEHEQRKSLSYLPNTTSNQCKCRTQSQPPEVKKKSLRARMDEARLSNLTLLSTERDISMDKNKDEGEEDGAVISGNITAHSSGTRSSLTCSKEFLDTGYFRHWTFHVFSGLDSFCHFSWIGFILPAAGGSHH